MNILNDVVSGAARQFGREFGRAGANSILKGANYYAVKGVSDYSGRIKPSDSEVVKTIKEINKVKFVSTNKGNISRLIDLTDLVISNLNFNGNQTLFEINDITELINQYNDKFNHGSALVDDDYKEKSVDYLEERRNEFVRLMDKFNNDIKNHIQQNFEIVFLFFQPLQYRGGAFYKSEDNTVLFPMVYQIDPMQIRVTYKPRY
jgi:hypothetical protein